MDKSIFYDEVRKSLFRGSLNESQVAGMEADFAELQLSNITNRAAAGYVFATDYHETGTRMCPVREGFCKTDQGSRNAVLRLYQRGIISTNYALPDPLTGHSYYGRGKVQITWPDNYKRLGRHLGIDLYGNPDLALDMTISAKILVQGMKYGLFVKGHTLDRYFNDTETDPVGARHMINGIDKANQIAGHARDFTTALARAGYGDEPVKPSTGRFDNLFAKVGSTGPYVATIQTLLTKHGFRTSIDGDFGPATRDNLIAFQRSCNLIPDGIAGPKTFVELMK